LPHESTNKHINWLEATAAITPPPPPPSPPTILISEPEEEIEEVEEDEEKTSLTELYSLIEDTTIVVSDMSVRTILKICMTVMQMKRFSKK
jgi:hypothetical protein